MRLPAGGASAARRGPVAGASAAPRAAPGTRPRRRAPRPGGASSPSRPATASGRAAPASGPPGRRRTAAPPRPRRRSPAPARESSQPRTSSPATVAAIGFQRWAASCSRSSATLPADPGVGGPERVAEPAGGRAVGGPLEREQPHRVQQHRQRADLVVQHRDQRRHLVPLGRPGEQRPQPAGEDDADEVHPEREPEDVLADDADRLAARAARAAAAGGAGRPS